VKNLSLATVAAVFCLSLVARADTHYTGFSKLSPSGLPWREGLGDMTWEGEDQNPSFFGVCGEINFQYKTNIPCTMDHKSFEAFYAKEFKHPKLADRVNTSPATICGLCGIDNISGSHNSFCTESLLNPYCYQDDDCRKQFADRVKSIVCSIADKEGPPTVTLEKGILKLVMTRNANGDMPGAGQAIQDAALKLFPRYKAIYDSHH
jgi:hypothetical protein